MELVPIHIAARELGVRPETLRRWEAQGRIEPPERTRGGRRRYDLAKLRALAPRKGAPSVRLTLAYACVSSHDGKERLVRQVALLESFCTANGWAYEVLQDVGSGLDYHKKSMRVLVRRIGSGEIGRLVITHKDRLLRFGSELSSLDVNTLGRRSSSSTPPRKHLLSLGTSGCRMGLKSSQCSPPACTTAVAIKIGAWSRP